MEFEYVIVGAGSAGCILANRLSAGNRNRVLLLEAGPDDNRFFLKMPLGYGMSFYNPALNWMYWSEPDPGLGGRVSYVPRGKVLGGSSSINAMVYLRGDPGDYDDWAAQGNRGWGWTDVRPAFETIERDLKPESMAPGAHPLCHAYLEGARQLNLAISGDFNRDGLAGAGYNPVNIHRGRRQSASRVFLRPILRRPNLKVETAALATRILFDGQKAIGITYRKDANTIEVRATREVILAAGAINTPQLLQLSGVGPGALLRDNGIPVVSASEAVGRNLQDHVAYDHYYRARVPTMNQLLRPLHGKLLAGLRYLLLRSGPLAWSMNHAGGFIASRPGLSRPNLQIYFCPSSYDRSPPKTRKMTEPDDLPGLSIGVSSCRPKSRGSVGLASGDPLAAPKIDLRLLSEAEDVQELLEGARFLRRLAATPALAAVLAEEFKPGSTTVADEQMIADIRARGYSIFHPCGTARMGPDPRSNVVDDRLNVHGIGGLRIADASIFPSIPGCNINAAAMMVGQRGAELISGRA